MIPETYIEIDGKQYNLRFSARTIINVEKKMGKPISTLSDVAPSEISVDLLSIFFSEAIRDINGDKIQPEIIEEILDNIQITDLSKYVEEGFNTAFPKETREKKGKN